MKLREVKEISQAPHTSSETQNWDLNSYLHCAALSSPLQFSL
jgi:hypothetical protein